MQMIFQKHAPLIQELSACSGMPRLKDENGRTQSKLLGIVGHGV